MSRPPSIENDIDVLKNPARSVEERAHAAQRLANVLSTDALPDERFDTILALFYRMYHEPEVPAALRRRLLPISATVPRPWHYDAIRAAWDHPDPAWQEAAMVAMATTPGFEAAIREALDAGAPSGAYRQALRAAGRRELFDVEPHLRHVAIDESAPKSYRLAAIRSLGEVAAAESLAPLRTLTEHADHDIARAAYDALAALGVR